MVAKLPKLLSARAFAKWIAVIILISPIILLFSILFIFIFLSTDIMENKPLPTYQYTEISPLTNHTNQGIITSFRDIKTFDSYVDKIGSHHLISNFGDQKYMCSGSCFCDETRRTSQALLTRGLTAAVASATILLAHHYAREQFHEECQESFKDICEPDSIRAEVEDCAVFAQRQSYVEKTRKGHGGKSKGRKKGKRGTQRYQCRGTCVFTRFTETPEAAEEANKALKLFGGEAKFFTRLKNRIFPKEWFSLCASLSLENTLRAKNINLAYYRFVADKLEPYCRESGSFEVEKKDGSTFVAKFCSGFMFEKNADWIQRNGWWDIATLKFGEKNRKDFSGDEVSWWKRGLKRKGLETTKRKSPVGGNRSVLCRNLSDDEEVVEEVDLKKISALIDSWKRKMHIE